MFRRKNKLIPYPKSLPSISPRVPQAIPLLQYILSYIELAAIVNLIRVNKTWQTLLNEQYQEMHNLKMLSVLKSLSSLGASREHFLQTLSQIFKALQSSPVTFQINILRAAIYYLQQPEFISTKKLLFPRNSVKLYNAEIISNDKPTITSIRQLNSDEEKQETIEFNKVFREIMALYTSFNQINIEDQRQMNQVFIAKLKEEYLRVKYDYRDKSPLQQDDLLGVMNITINIIAEKAKASLNTTKSRLSTVEIVFYTLIIFNALVAFYRIYNSPHKSKDIFDIFMQAGVIVTIILLPLALSKYYYGYMNEQNEQFTLFSSSKANRDAELDTLLEPDADADSVLANRIL